MIASEAFRAGLATDDIVLFLCPQPECRSAFNCSQLGVRVVCPPHDCSATGKICLGSSKPFDIRYIGAADFEASDPLNVTESKSSGDKEVLDAKEAHEVTELERL